MNEPKSSFTNLAASTDKSPLKNNILIPSTPSFLEAQSKVDSD